MKISLSRAVVALAFYSIGFCGAVYLLLLMSIDNLDPWVGFLGIAIFIVFNRLGIKTETGKWLMPYSGIPFAR